jgi:hypothetical protein
MADIRRRASLPQRIDLRTSQASRPGMKSEASTAALLRYNADRSEQKRRDVQTALAELAEHPRQPINKSNVARRAGVSREFINSHPERGKRAAGRLFAPTPRGVASTGRGVANGARQPTSGLRREEVACSRVQWLTWSDNTFRCRGAAREGTADPWTSGPFRGLRASCRVVGNEVCRIASAGMRSTPMRIVN